MGELAVSRGVGTSAIYDAIASGEVRSIRIGSVVRVVEAQS